MADEEKIETEKPKRRTKAKSGGGKVLIVESPTKVHTIKKFLSSSFKVLATKGHIKDLPKSKLGVDVDNNFEPSYIVMRDKRKILSEIKKEVKGASEIFLGADPDREGEAICWHVADELKKLGDAKISRVMFNEITKTAVLKSLENPQEINMNLVNAQQARRILDRLVGYKISPLLWKSIRKGLSAGRVQSVALKLIVDRQKEIDAFKPVEYWSIEALLENIGKQKFTAKLTEKDGQKIDLKIKEEADKIVEELKTQDYIVSDIQKKERSRRPLPPFITSTMQQESAKRYRYTAQKTMVIAQQLYEGVLIHGEGHVGLITYMRTDSLRVSADAQKEALDYIKSTFGGQYAPATPNFYKSKKSSQDAHEAIRPTSVLRSPESVKESLNAEQFKLYTLVWNRFVASQMVPAVFDDTRVKIKSGSYLLQANGSVKRFDGFLRVYDIAKTEEPEAEQNNGNGNNNKEGDADKETLAENQLPELRQDEKLGLVELIPGQHFTQPPPAYTDATLVKALEEKDIGRPSTYAPIISTIVARKYVEREKGKFKPTELGTIVSDILLKNFSDIINEQFTAKMEDDLDAVEEGTVEWKQLLKNFYTGFEVLLQKALPNMEDVKKTIETETGKVCEICGKKMIVKWGRHGKFLACSGYPECKNTKPLGEQKPEDKIDEKCPKCGSPLVIKQGPFGKFIACSNYPACKYTRQIIISTGIKCPDCGTGDIIERTFKRFRKFYGCSNYPNCKFMVWDKPIDRKCPVCGAPFLLEKWKKDKTVIYCKKCDFKEDKPAAQNE